MRNALPLKWQPAFDARFYRAKRDKIFTEGRKHYIYAQRLAPKVATGF